jgi:crotonobetainyl-CoA:carnitine CoA-transferase CaiB-like acyl-CoA transferase
MQKLQAGGVPAGVVQTGADLLKDPQLRHRDYFAALPQSLIGPFEIPRAGFVFRGAKEEPFRLPSRFGADNDAILGGILGYDKETIARWREEEVLT